MVITAAPKLETLIKSGYDYITNLTESELTFKPNPQKWSKKEIVGHLIDSAINNLLRFTEISFENKPYRIRKYNQDEWVKANHYQMADTAHLMELWNSLNYRIINIMKIQTEPTLDYRIELENEHITDLRFLMNDYVAHLEHHLHQIMDKKP